MKSDESMEKPISVVSRIKAVEKFPLAGDEGDSSLTPRKEMTRRDAKPKITKKSKRERNVSEMWSLQLVMYNVVDIPVSNRKLEIRAVEEKETGS
ncbi:hypothetical protein Y032_0413g1016 [Ancylostoma ceylanicum]|nr:hypothetical protein Y032_0413g1016 [Ancylostoma ceylanicum]